MIKTIISYLPSVIIPTIISLITTVLYGNYMKAEQYGEYNIFITTLSIFNTLFFSFMSSSMLRFYNSFEKIDKQYKIISLYVVTTLGLLLILTVIIIPFKGIESIYIISCLASIGFFNLYSNLLRASENKIWFNVIKSLFPIGTLLLVLFFVLNDNLNTSNAIFSMYVPMGIITIVMTIIYFKKGLIRFTSGYDKTLLKETINYGMPLAFSGLLYLVMASSDRFMISYFLGNEQVGIYSFAYRIAELSLVNVTMIIMLALYPQLVKVYDSFGKQKAEALLTKYLSLHFIVIIPVVMLMILYVDELMDIIFPIYSEGDVIVKFTIIGTLFFSISTYTDKAFQLTKNTTVMLRILLISGIINILLNLILIPKLGVNGAIIATIFSYIIYILLSLILSKKFMNIVFPMKFLSYILVVNFSISYFVIVLDEKLLINDIGRVCIGILSYIILYSIIIYFTFKYKKRNLEY